MNPILDQLHDIEGLDPISFWPLATAWWIVIAFGVAFIAIAIYYIIYLIKYKRSWKNDSLRKLTALEKTLTEMTTRETVIILSEYLRRIACRRFPRNECAGIVGEPWLLWLTKHDQKKFDWKKNGRLLIEVPYSPLNAKISLTEVKTLLKAVKSWVV